VAIVGEAHIIVRALTDKVDGDIKRGFSGLSAAPASTAGGRFAKAFSAGFNKSADASVFKRFSDGIANAGAASEGAARRFSSLVKTGYSVQAALGSILGGLSAVIGGLVSLGGSALGAAGSLAIVGNAGFAMAAGMIAAKLALGGVGKALSALNRQGGGAVNNTAQIVAAEQRLAQVIETNRENLIDANNAVRDAQLELNKAIKEGQEEIQQLGFAAEDAALSEQKAALELERAREALARVQDLPPNSRARKEAELAYQEAELNLRKAKDNSADLNKEQDRLARTGVSGTEAVIKASGRLAEAEAQKARTIRDGLRQQADAERALADARSGGGGGGGADPFAGLNQFQIDFVKFLSGLKPLLDQIKLQVAGAFLPPLQEAITTLVVGLYPTVLQGLTLIAGSLGVAVKSIASAMVEAKSVSNLASLFESSAKLIESFGRIIGNVYSSILAVLVAAAPQAQRFADFLEKTTGEFKAFATSAEGEAAMSDFFQRSGDAAAKFGEIFGNIFGGIGGIINANLGPGTGGDYLLNWLITATQKFQDLGKVGADGISPMGDYFNKVAVNAQKVLSSIGALLEELIKLGTNEAIGETFDILATGAPFLGQILQAGADAGPAMAELIVSLTRIGAALADAGQPIAFFKTLNVVASVLATFFESTLVQAILKVVGPIIGVVGAIGTMLSLGSLAGGVLLFWFGQIKTALTVLFALIQKNPVVAIITVIVAALIYLYNTNEAFAASMDAVFAQLSAVFGQVMAALQPVIAMLISQMIPIIDMLAVAFGQIMMAIAPLIPMLIEALVPAFMSIVNALIPLVTMIATTVVPIFMQLLQTLIPIVVTIIEMLVPVIVQLIEAFVPLITQVISAVIPALMQLVTAFLPLVTMIISTVMPVIVQLVETMAPLIATIIEMLVPVIITLVEAFMPLVITIMTMVVPIIAELVKALMPVITTIIQMLVPVIEFLIKAFAAIIPPVMQVVMAIISFLLPIITTIISVFTGLISFLPKIGQAFSDVWNGVVSFFKGVANFMIGIVEGMVNGMINAINNFTRPFKDAISAVVGFFGGGNITFGNIPNIRLPRLAEGGVVSPRGGGTIAQIAEAGKPERVEPLDANGMSKRDKFMVDLIKAQKGNAGTINITVNPAPGMDERELAAAISREISFQMRRGAVA
jgi:phage-related protein